MNSFEIAKAETAYRGDRIHSDLTGLRRRHTRIPFVGRKAEVNRRGR